MSLIWKIGLFKKINPNQAECLDCKAEGRQKFTFELPKGSVKALRTHLFTQLHNQSEYAEKYRKMEASQNENESNQAKISDLLPKSTSKFRLEYKIKINLFSRIIIF
jgi:hypothetical protein